MISIRKLPILLKMMIFLKYSYNFDMLHEEQRKRESELIVTLKQTKVINFTCDLSHCQTNPAQPETVTRNVMETVFYYVKV